MPCSSAGYETRSFGNYESKIKILESMLCHAFTIAEDQILNAPLEVYVECGTKRVALQAWWDNHKAEDEKRREFTMETKYTFKSEFVSTGVPGCESSFWFVITYKNNVQLEVRTFLTAEWAIAYKRLCERLEQIRIDHALGDASGNSFVSRPAVWRPTGDMYGPYGKSVLPSATTGMKHCAFVRGSPIV